MDLRDQAMRGVAWSAVQNWGSRAISFLVIAVLTRLLAPEAFGLVALASVYVALVEIFVDQGFADALIQREDLTDAHRDTAFWVSLALGAVLAGASYAAAPLLARAFGEAALGPVVRGLAPAFVLAALAGVQQALFERALDYRALALRALVAMTVGGGVGVGLAAYGFGVWALVGYQLAERATAAVVLWAASDWRPGLRVTRTAFGDLARFGAHVVGANLLGFLNKRLDNLLIGLVLGPVALGYYEIAYKLLTTGTQLLVGTVSSVAFSTFSRLQGDLPRMRAAFLSAIRVSSVVAFPAFVGAAAVAPDLVPALFGPGWTPSVRVFQALAGIGVLYALFYFNTAVFLGAGKPGWRLGLSLLNAAANVAVFVVAVRYGIVAVALAFTVRGYVLAPVALVALRHLVGLSLRAYARALAAPALATALMAAAVLALRLPLAGAPRAARLSLTILAGAAVYAFALRLTAPRRLADLWRLARRFVR